MRDWIAPITVVTVAVVLVFIFVFGLWWISNLSLKVERFNCIQEVQDPKWCYQNVR